MNKNVHKLLVCGCQSGEGLGGGWGGEELFWGRSGLLSVALAILHAHDTLVD